MICADFVRIIGNDNYELLSTSIDYREAIVDAASSLLGSVAMKYIYGNPELGQDPDVGFDCSGFVTFVLNHAGLQVPDYMGQDGQLRPIRHASEYWDHYGVLVHADLRQPGDLIFFSRTGEYPSHIGIVRDEETYIHSPGQDGQQVCVAPIEKCPITGEYKKASRKLYVENPIGFKVPTVALDKPSYRYHQRIL